MGNPVTRRLMAGCVATAALLLGATGHAQEGTAPPAAPPTEEDIAIAVADLARAAELTDPAERAQAVGRNAGVASPKVVKALTRFLKDKQDDVRLAALDALGRTAHADALKELHRTCQSDSKLREDAARHAALLKAIGRHADADSLKVLADGAWKVTDEQVVKARLYAIGNIRTKAAAAQLMHLMNTDPTIPWETSPYMEHFRVALSALSGEDHREDKDAWRAWWREAEKTLKFGGGPPRLPPDLQMRWDAFWKLPAEPKPAPELLPDPAPESAPDADPAR